MEQHAIKTFEKVLAILNCASVVVYACTGSTYVVGILQTAFVAFRHAVIGHGHDDDVECNAERDEELKDQIRYNAANNNNNKN